MITLPKALLDKYDDWLEREAVDANRHGEHRKWLRVVSRLIGNTSVEQFGV